MKQRQAMVRQAWVLFIWLVLVTGFALWRVRAPLPLPETAPPTEFSAVRALQHLEEVAKAPRPVGSAENARVRAYLLAQFKALGLEAKVETGTSLEGGRVPRLATVQNVLAHLPGSAGDNGPALMLAAHYDSVPTGPGAADDGSGVVTLLETARALKAGSPLKNGVYFLLTDGEEVGLLGARAFVERSPVAKRVSTVLNFEARGNGGPVFMFETSDGNRTGAGAGNAALIAEFGKSVPYPVASSLMYAIYKRMPNDTDLTVFRRGGMAGLNFSFIDGWNHYHTALDNLQTVSLASVQHHGSYVLALARQLGNADLDALKVNGGGDAVYFDLFGYTLIRYPQAWGLWLTIGVGVLYLLTVVVGFRQKQLTAGGFFVGVIAPLLCLAIVYFGFGPLWSWLKSWNPEYFNALPWGEPYNRVWYEWAFGLLALAVVLLVYSLLIGQFSARDLGLGALLWWLFLLIGATFYLPGATYAFTWPLLFALLACLTNFGIRNPTQDSFAAGRMFVLCLTAVVSLALWVVLFKGIWFSLSLNQPVLVPGMIVLVVAGTLLPHFWVIMRPALGILPTLCLLLSAVFFAVGHFTGRFDSRHRGVTSLIYAKDTALGPAVWVSADRVPNPWTAGFLQNNRREVNAQELFPWRSGELTVGDAPEVDLAVPNVTIESNTVTSGLRTVHLRITLPQPDAILLISSDPATPAVWKKVLADEVLIPTDGKAFQFQHLTVPTTGVVLKLTFEDSPNLPVLLVDMLVSGLPAVDGKPVQKPETLMASPRDRYLSDATLVRCTFPLPPTATLPATPAPPAPENTPEDTPEIAPEPTTPPIETLSPTPAPTATSATAPTPATVPTAPPTAEPPTGTVPAKRAPTERGTDGFPYYEGPPTPAGG